MQHVFISPQRAARLIRGTLGISVPRFRESGHREMLLDTGAKLKDSRHGWMVAGYAADGSDVAPYRPFAVEPRT